MRVNDFTYLLEKPDMVNSPVQINQLEEILETYPYFQAARAMHLKGLKSLNSFKYNNALKVTAAYTTDRDILFDFITSPEFLNDKKEKQEVKKTEVENNNLIVTKEILEEPNTNVKAIAETKPFIDKDSKDKPLPQNIEDAEKILDKELFEVKEDLQIGKPLSFNKEEKHSFIEWLNIAAPKEDLDNNTDKKSTESSRKKKFKLIDKFIEERPKIIPKESSIEIDIKDSVKLNKNELMTATLAKVYLEQKKYKKAIQAYKILSLKYPEKSSFFADQIKLVQKIQKENS